MNELKHRFDELKSRATSLPSDAIMFRNRLQRFEKKITALNNHSMLDMLLFRKKESVNAVSDELAQLQDLFDEVYIFSKEIDGVRAQLEQFHNDVEGLRFDALESFAEQRARHLEFCEKGKSKLIQWLYDCKDPLSVQSAKADLNRFKEALNRYSENVRILIRLRELYDDYKNAPEITELISRFEQAGSNYVADSEFNVEVLHNIEQEFDVIRNRFASQYPKFSLDTEDELNEINDWLYSLSEDVSEDKFIQDYQQHYEYLENKYQQQKGAPFQGINSDENDDIEQQVSILLDDIKTYVEQLLNNKLAEKEPLLGELRSHLPGVNSLLNRYGELTSGKTPDMESYRGWRRSYEVFDAEFKSYMNSNISDLRQILQDKIDYIGSTLEKVEAGPCSKAVNSNAKVINESLKQFRDDIWSTDSEGITNTLIKIRETEKKAKEILEQAKTERTDYQSTKERLQDEAYKLDEEIKRSGLHTETLSIKVAQNIKDINSSDISVAIEELGEIELILEESRAGFREACLTAIQKHREKRLALQSTFYQLGLDFPAFTDKEEESVELLLYSRQFHNELENRLEKSTETFEQNKSKAIVGIHKALSHPDVPVYEKEELRFLNSDLENWKIDQDRPDTSLLALKTLIDEVENCIAHYAREENNAREHAKQLQYRLETFKSQYDRNLFPAAMSRMSGMIAGAACAIDHWSGVTKQLQQAESTLVSLETEAKRIAVSRFEDSDKKLQTYLQKYHANHVLPHDYQEAQVLQQELGGFQGKLPPRSLQIRLDNLIRRLDTYAG